MAVPHSRTITDLSGVSDEKKRWRPNVMAKTMRTSTSFTNINLNLPNPMANKSRASVDSSFSRNDFDPEAFTQDLFESAPEERAREELQSILETKETTAQRLKYKVYFNYPKFISSSQEIAKLEVEMLEMRNILNDFSANMKGLSQITLSHSDAGEKERKSQIPKVSRRTPQHISQAEDINFLLDMPDELDVLLLERRFAEAVALVQKGTRLLLENNFGEHLRKELDDRIAELSKLLAQDLQNPNLKKLESRTIISHMLSLGLGDEAREIFLDTRSKYIKKEIRKLNFEGDISSYISELSKLVFSCISTTCEDFRHSFPDHSMMSGFMVWVTQEIVNFVKIFHRQVFYTEDFATIVDCVKIATDHCILLQRRGLSLSFFLQAQFLPSIQQALLSYASRMETSLGRIVSDETWTSSSHWLYEITKSSTNTGTSQVSPVPPSPKTGDTKPDSAYSVELTDSGKHFYTLTQRFVNETLQIMTVELVPVFFESLRKVFEGYFDQLYHLIQTCVVTQNPQQTQLSDKQIFCIMSNCMNIADDLVPRLTKQIERTLERPAVELEECRNKLNDKIRQMRETYAIQRSDQIVHYKLDWGNTDYSLVKLTGLPSTKFRKFAEYIRTLALLITKYLTPKAVTPILSVLVQNVTFGLANPRGGFWEKFKTYVDEKSLNQLTLDLRFYEQVIYSYLSRSARDHFRAALENVSRTYCRVHKVSNESVPLKDENWFKEGILNALGELEQQKI